MNSYKIMARNAEKTRLRCAPRQLMDAALWTANVK
jgi:hypothetical protein